MNSKTSIVIADALIAIVVMAFVVLVLTFFMNAILGIFSDRKLDYFVVFSTVVLSRYVFYGFNHLHIQNKEFLKKK